MVYFVCLRTLSYLSYSRPKTQSHAAVCERGEFATEAASSSSPLLRKKKKPPTCVSVVYSFFLSFFLPFSTAFVIGWPQCASETPSFLLPLLHRASTVVVFVPSVHQQLQQLWPSIFMLHCPGSPSKFVGRRRFVLTKASEDEDDDDAKAPIVDHRGGRDASFWLCRGNQARGLLYLAPCLRSTWAYKTRRKMAALYAEGTLRKSRILLYAAPRPVARKYVRTKGSGLCGE